MKSTNKGGGRVPSPHLRKMDRKKKKSPLPWKTLFSVGLGLVILVAIIVIAAKGCGGDTPTSGAIFGTPPPAQGATPTPNWEDNVRPEPVDKYVMTWDYKPTAFEGVPEGANVLCPTWLYVEEGESGAPNFENIADQGVSADFEGYVNGAHGAGAEVWGTVVSFNPELSKQVITDGTTRQAFCAWLAEQVEALNLDGLCLDFERMDPDNKMDYSALVFQVKSSLPKDKTVCVSVTVKTAVEQPDNWYQSYDYPSLAEAADYIALMAYDQHTISSEAAGPGAALPWVEDRLQRALWEIPSDQLILGIPFYGYDFPHAIPEGTKDVERDAEPVWKNGDMKAVAVLRAQVEKLNSDGEVTVRNQALAVDHWVTRDTWSDEFQVRYLSFVDKQGLLHRLWYEDDQSVAKKASLVKQYHLKGAAVWQQDYGRDSMWRAVFDAVQ